MKIASICVLLLILSACDKGSSNKTQRVKERKDLDAKSDAVGVLDTQSLLVDTTYYNCSNPVNQLTFSTAQIVAESPTGMSYSTHSFRPLINGIRSGGDSLQQAYVLILIPQNAQCDSLKVEYSSMHLDVEAHMTGNVYSNHKLKYIEVDMQTLLREIGVNDSVYYVSEFGLDIIFPNPIEPTKKWTRKGRVHYDHVSDKDTSWRMVGT